MLDFGNSALPVASDIAGGVDRAWHRFASPGTWWTANERVELLMHARQAMAGEEPFPAKDVPHAAAEAARKVAADAVSISQPWVFDLEDRGVTPLQYVELVGLVGRLAAIDTYVSGVGADEVPLPDPIAGEPSREVVHGAERRHAWVPIDGPAGASTALNSVPAELSALEDLHGALYLSFAGMGDRLAVRDGLHRMQMELVAARTSYLNECFY